ncbi:MAG: hypothetical protein ACTHK8_22135 [Ginsengibacter sp.]
MSEILLQAIVEKLESLELVLLKQNSEGKDEELKAAVKSIQSSFTKFNAACDANNKKIDSLSEDIHALQETNSQVRHIHHFQKQVWISVSVFIISLLLAFGWLNCSNEKKSFEANDMKYRYWKANGNASLLKIIYYTDSLYNLDEDQFTNEVFLMEHQIDEQNKIQRLAAEKKKSKK